MAGAIERMYATLMDRGYVKTLFGYLQDFQERAGGYIARCPFHEDEHPTLIIYRDRPGYFCFVCGARGDWLRFLQLAKGMDFLQALDMLGRESAIDTRDLGKADWEGELSRSTLLELMAEYFTAQLYSPAGEKELFYLYRRRYAMGEVEGSSFGFYPGRARTREHLFSQGVETALVDTGMQGFWMEDAEEFRLTIPYRDSSGRLMGMIGRDVSKKGPEAYRPLTDLSALSDVPFLLYRHRGAEELLVVEGLLDALLVDRIDYRPVVGVGREGLNAAQCETLARYGTRRCILCFGGGKRELMLSSASKVEASGMEAIFLPLEEQYEDLDHFIRSTELHDFRKLLRRTQTREEFLRHG
ncbi:MAG: CHC2 zinc finger domain-containing protein [Desulfomonilia bacterium]